MFNRLLSKKNRALLAELVRTDFKLRYQGSVLGYAWSLLRPLFMFAILYIVFARFLKLGAGIDHYPSYLLLGIVLWNFFNEMTVQSLGSIVGRSELIRKIKIPRWIIVFSTSLSALINLFLNLIVVAVFLVINHVSLHASAWWFIPIVLEIYILALGLSLFLSATFVKFRDIQYVWEVVLQAGFYLTPILYLLNRIPSLTFQKILMLNPMAQTIQDARHVVVTPQSATIYQVFNSGWYKFTPFIIVAIILILGIRYFKKESKSFAENV